jgi:radical SAM superfamily enzyme YgiQ (UPF0313 family)
MKILLVSASIEEYWRAPAIESNSHYPLGLAYLHAVLELRNHTVKTLFLNDFDYAESTRIVTEEIASFCPQVVGFNLLTANRVNTFSLINHIEENHGQIQVLLGGIHATNMSRQLLETYPTAIVVVGEGENTAMELIDRLEANESYDDVRGIVYVKDGEVITTPSRPLIEDLDALPFPKHDIFFGEDRTFASILTSRGCPFKCSFCVLDSISRRNVRYRSVENVVDEIEHLVNTYPQLETVWMHDDNFLLQNRRAMKFADEIIRRDIHVKLICSSRLRPPLSVELVKALEKAGFVQILFGLESGSPKILKSTHKQVGHEDIIESFTNLAETRIQATAFLIVGLYGEDENTVQETIDFVQKIQKIKYLYYSDIGVLSIFPGTEIYDIAKEAGIIDDSFWLTDQTTPIFEVEHDVETLMAYKKQILDHISLDRLLSFKGMMAQYKMIPTITRSYMGGSTQTKRAILGGLAQNLNRLSPRLYRSLKSSYRQYLRSEH